MDEYPYIGRVVTLLTPVFAGIAGWVATLAADYLPGAPDLDEAELTAIFVAGALAAAGVVFKWVDNLGDHEVTKQSADFQREIRDAADGAPHAPVGMTKPE